MCQTSVIVEKDGNNETIMDSISKLEVTAEGLTLCGSFEEPKLMKGLAIKEIDFSEGVVTLVSTV